MERVSVRATNKQAVAPVGELSLVGTHAGSPVSMSSQGFIHEIWMDGQRRFQLHDGELQHSEIRNGFVNVLLTTGVDHQTLWRGNLAAGESTVKEIEGLLTKAASVGFVVNRVEFYTGVLEVYNYEGELRVQGDSRYIQFLGFTSDAYGVAGTRGGMDFGMGAMYGPERTADSTHTIGGSIETFPTWDETKPSVTFTRNWSFPVTCTRSLDAGENCFATRP